MKGRHAPVFDVLWGTQASEAAVDHDGKPCAHSLALLHAAGDRTRGEPQPQTQGSNQQWDGRAERHTITENQLNFHTGTSQNSKQHTGNG